MGLRCLIGHDFGDLQTEEEQESRGDEEVITIREYRECSRCGEQKVISENKEVTASKDLAPDLQNAEAAVDDEARIPTTGRPDTGGELEQVSAEEDDGVILEDDEDIARDHGEWPAREDTIEPDIDPQSWPETSEEDEGFDAEPSEGGPAEEVDFRGGLTPERRSPPPTDAGSTRGEMVEEIPDDEQFQESTTPDAETDPNATPGAEANAQPEQGGGQETDSAGTDVEKADTSSAGSTITDSGITSADTGPEPAGPQRPDGETEFVCPECDHTAEASGSSLRPGDICPECHRGYLLERERQT